MEKLQPVLLTKASWIKEIVANNKRYIISTNPFLAYSTLGVVIASDTLIDTCGEVVIFKPTGYQYDNVYTSERVCSITLGNTWPTTSSYSYHKYRYTDALHKTTHRQDLPGDLYVVPYDGISVDVSSQLDMLRWQDDVCAYEITKVWHKAQKIKTKPKQSTQTIYTNRNGYTTPSGKPVRR